MNNGNIPGIIKWGGEDIYGHRSACDKVDLLTFLKFFFSKNQSGVGTLICLDVEKIQRDHGFAASVKGGLSN